MASDPAYLFGFQDEIISINFPASPILIVEGQTAFNRSREGNIELFKWSSPRPTPLFTIVTDQTGLTGFYLNDFTSGDPNPGAKITKQIIEGNYAWAFPRPSAVVNGLVNGMGFFNLALFGSDFSVQLICLTSRGDTVTMRASIWDTVPDFTKKIADGQLIDTKGALDVAAISVITPNLRSPLLEVTVSGKTVSIANITP